MNSGELKVDVPLAATEESDCDDGSSDNQSHTPKRSTTHMQSLPKSTPPNSTSTPKRLDPNKKNETPPRKASPRFNIDTGGDSVTGSLEDLVTSFDEKITLCFKDYQEQVDKIAPVQVTRDCLQIFHQIGIIRDTFNTIDIFNHYLLLNRYGHKKK